MKARTKSARLKQKRGRPALSGIERQPNGQPSRRKAALKDRQEMSQAAIMSTAIERRIRHDNIVPFKEKGGKLHTAEEQAKDPRRGYTLGLMLIDHSITQRQHDAGVKYAEQMSRYYGLTGTPFPSARAQNLFAIRGNEGEEPESKADAARKARHTANLLRDVLLGVGNIDQGRKVQSAVNELAILDNTHCRRWPEHMHHYLRQGLNRLADYFEG